MGLLDPNYRKELTMANNAKRKPNSRRRKPSNTKNCGNNRDVKLSSRDTKDDIGIKPDRGYNDPSWYNASNQLVIDACSLGFATPLGLPLEVHSGKFKIPGIMRLDYVPSIGLSQDNTSPINMAAQSIYSYVNYANSRNTSYDRTDMMMFLLAMDSAYSYLSFLKRVYGIARIYSATNRYLPTSLLESMGLDAVNIVNNLNNLRSAINTFAAKLGSFFVPATFTYLQRHSWMNYNIFSDSDKPFKSQLYYYYQQAYYKYDETTSPNGTSLVYTPMPIQTGGLRFPDLVGFGNQLLDPILNSQDVGIMGSDMLKAFGESGLVKMNTIDSDFTIDISYSPEVLTQIQNTIAVGTIATSQHIADITQDNTSGYIIQVLKSADSYNNFKNTALSGARDYFINMPMVNPSPDDVMVATRNMSWISRDNLIHSGSEVVTQMSVFNDPTDISKKVTFGTSCIITGSAAYDAFVKYAEILGAITPFNMHPRLLMGSQIGSGGDLSEVKTQIVCDFENYTPLPVIDLQKMHEVALLSMFNVPQYGTFNG